MTVKLAGFRMQPLLNPPGTFRFQAPEFTQDDRLVVEENLAGCRKDGYGIGAARILRSMAELGHAVPAADGDAGLYSESAGQYRERKEGFSLAGLLADLRHVGLAGKPSQDDASLMLSTLDSLRSTKNPGYNIAQMHRWLLELGVDAEVTVKDRKAMAGQLASDRAKGYGRGILLLHYNMRSIGVETELKPDDWRLMSAEPERARLGGRGIEVAEGHVWLRRILQLERQGDDSIPLPPLRRFAR